MGNVLKVLFAVGLLALGLGLPKRADAQVYKYTRDDGVVVFTDKLSDLPPERRAYYSKKAKAAEDQRRRERARKAPEQLRREALEAQRAQLARKKLNKEAEQHRRREFEDMLREIRKEKEKQEQANQFWREKKSEAEQALADALSRYNEALKEWESLAIKASFSLFPGQRVRLNKLQQALPQLAAAVEAANTYLTETLPAEARRAGIPPGVLH